MASTYKVHNDSVFEIYVYIDTRHETHVIVPNGIAIFVKRNPLDRPTFHVCVSKPDHTEGQELTSMKVSYWDAIKASGEYTFDGGRLR